MVAEKNQKIQELEKRNKTLEIKLVISNNQKDSINSEIDVLSKQKDSLLVAFKSIKRPKVNVQTLSDLAIIEKADSLYDSTAYGNHLIVRRSTLDYLVETTIKEEVLSYEIQYYRNLTSIQEKQLDKYKIIIDLYKTDATYYSSIIENKNKQLDVANDALDKTIKLYKRKNRESTLIKIIAVTALGFIVYDNIK